MKKSVCWATMFCFPANESVKPAYGGGGNRMSDSRVLAGRALVARDLFMSAGKLMCGVSDSDASRGNLRIGTEGNSLAPEGPAMAGLARTRWWDESIGAACLTGIRRERVATR